MAKPDEVALVCDRPGSIATVRWGAAGASSARFVWRSSRPAQAVVTLGEFGGEMEWRFFGEQAFRAIAARPPRFGIDAAVIAGAEGLEVRSVSALRNATVAISLHCAPDDAVRELPDCVRRAVEVASSGSGAVGTAVASGDVCSAMLVHAEATFLSSRQRAGESAARYGEARRLWADAGYPAQAAVAHYAVAEQLSRAGRLEDGLRTAEAAEVELVAVQERYFAARSRGLRCLLLRNLGRVTEALHCGRGLPEQYFALGEINDAANEWQNQGSIAVSEGRLEDARIALEAALALDSAALQPLTRGRLHLLAASLASAEGRFGSAFESLEAGMASFEKAANARWQANALLQAAALYSAMGGWRETAVLAEAARNLFPADEAPLRVAATRVLEGRALLNTGDVERAQTALRKAIEDYESGGVPLRTLEARILLLRVGSSAHEVRALEQSLSAREVPQNLRLTALEALAEHALEAGDLDHAKVLYRAMDAPERSLSDDAARILLAARLELAQGNAAAAREATRSLIDSGVSVARQAGSAELRHLAMRAVSPPRRLWIDATLVRSESEQVPVEEVWAVLLGSQSQAALSVANQEQSRDASALDVALSSALLVSQDGRAHSEEVIAAQRELMRYARARSSDLGPMRLPDLPTFQSGLRSGEEALMLALGREHVLALHVTATRAEVRQMGRTDEVLTELEALLTTLSTRDSRVDEIDALAESLGARLLPASVGRQTQSLLLLIDDELSAVPFSLLRPPGDAAPLVERVAVSVVSGWSVATSAFRTQPGGAGPVDAFVVPDPGSGDALSLPPLHGAAQEPAVIQAALGTREVRLPEPRYPVLRDALRRSGAWVHVATHGATRAGLQGYSGLWLLPEAGRNTGFVSWLRLLQNPIEAELVVLNACQLGESSDLSAPGAASFALAMSAAGARHVVAARWRVSDAASAQWVDPFYQHLSQRGTEHTGEALRQAQLRLRASRMFRHPFHWAGWMHLVRPSLVAEVR